jgi:alkanesulfonate monooxygenase SsuD/methylene tetrahydromethanopterin reductase-like flavin-dependent oxidoreductase (luciferase family)
MRVPLARNAAGELYRPASSLPSSASANSAASGPGIPCGAARHQCGQPDRAVQFTSEHYGIEEASIDLAPCTLPQIFVGGASAAAEPTAARQADAWLRLLAGAW